MIRVLKTTEAVDKRIELLELISALKLPSTSSADDTMARFYIQALIDLAKAGNVQDLDAYKSELEGLIFFERKEFQKAQNAFIRAIDLFDKSHRKIPGLLTVTRLTYNEIGNQEERYAYYTQKLQYYKINGPSVNVAACYHALGGYYLLRADYNLAISNYLKAADIYKPLGHRLYYNLLTVIANAYSTWGNYQKAIEYFDRSVPLGKQAKDSLLLTLTYTNIASLQNNLKEYEKSLTYADTGLSFDAKRGIPAYPAELYLEKAKSYIGLGESGKALENLRLAKSLEDNYHLRVFAAYGTVETDYGYYQYYAALKDYEKAITSLQAAYRKSVEVKSNQLQKKYLKELSLFYGAHNQPGLAFTYVKKLFDLQDELDKNNLAIKVAQYENEKRDMRQNDSLNLLKQQGAVQAAIIKKNNAMLWGSLVAIILISILLFFVYRQYRLNKLTLLSLRKTQRQLIVSEKMASLGEITAGIAHEIQNPLNFVTNFSEVNRELITEMKTELNRDNKEEAISISNHIDENEQKIHHHGLRADAIVKGMLQHSREGKGQKEATDLNELTDEYLRLSYQGFRAKDKSFHARVQTNYDPAIGKVEVVRQDIGRVLLNLYNNAFYAVSSGRSGGEQHNGSANGGPSVWVTTKRTGDRILICVKDNGAGIPQKLVDKIFQPFFTTKPTGQGTGLGLSLSYDIIKAHGGEIRVETKEGEGTEFIVQLHG